VAGGLIGAIQITERFSLVEVPEEVAEQVIKALGKSNIRGLKVTVRRDSGSSPAYKGSSPKGPAAHDGSSPPRKRGPY